MSALIKKARDRRKTALARAQRLETNLFDISADARAPRRIAAGL